MLCKKEKGSSQLCDEQKIEQLNQKIEEMRRVIIEKDVRCYKYFDEEIHKLIAIALNEKQKVLEDKISCLAAQMIELTPILKGLSKVRELKKRLFG